MDALLLVARGLGRNEQFSHNSWSDVVNISVESTAYPVMFLESIRVMEVHHEPEDKKSQLY